MSTKIPGPAFKNCPKNYGRIMMPLGLIEPNEKGTL